MDPYRKARIKIRNRKKFIWHAIFFVAISFILLLINVSIEGSPWCLIIIFPWSLILLVHLIIAFVFPSLNVFSSDWDDLQMEHELEKIGHQDALPEVDYGNYFEEGKLFSIRAMERIGLQSTEEDYV